LARASHKLPLLLLHLSDQFAHAFHILGLVRPVEVVKPRSHRPPAAGTATAVLSHQRSDSDEQSHGEKRCDYFSSHRQLLSEIHLYMWNQPWCKRRFVITIVSVSEDRLQFLNRIQIPGVRRKKEASHADESS
jgi:hypothetical protein